MNTELTCPEGIKNEKAIENIKDRMEMAIERIEEKITDIKSQMKVGFSDVNSQLSAVDKRFDKLERRIDEIKEELPVEIDRRIASYTGNRVLNVIKWIVITLGGSVTITLVTKLILNSLSL